MKKILMSLVALAIMSIGVANASTVWSYTSAYPKECVSEVIAPDGASFSVRIDQCIYSVEERDGRIYPNGIGGYINKNLPRKVYDARIFNTMPDVVITETETPTVTPQIIIETPPVSTYNYPLPTAIPVPRTGCQAAVCWNAGKIGNGLERSANYLVGGVVGSLSSLYNMFGQQ